MNVEIVKYPNDDDWMLAKQCTLVTIGKNPVIPPNLEWKKRLLAACHSPIRTLNFCFRLTDVPYWVSTHLVRHVHATPFVKSQRNDRQSDYDRRKAPQDAPVDLMWYMTAEELMTIAHKRLCNQASKETREVVAEMCRQVIEVCPEFDGLLVPLCEYRGGVCTEFKPCGRNLKINRDLCNLSKDGTKDLLSVIGASQTSEDDIRKTASGSFQFEYSGFDGKDFNPNG